MSKALIIAEKPSVAADIARSLGDFVKHQDYFESDKYVLSSAVGHLLELRAPEQYDVKRGKWTFTHLPVIPPHFDLAPIARSEARLKVLARLIKRKDVGQLINACDAGREGELIFRYIVQATKAKQPVRRLWLQSMTPAAIRDGFARLRSDEEMQPLADAATCRSESDWLVGINGTRAMTAFNSKAGGFQLTTVGRVQTPTLAVVVEREEQIRKFVSRDYWEIHGSFLAEAGEYPGKWFDPNWKKDPEDAEKRADRLWNEKDARAIADGCGGGGGGEGGGGGSGILPLHPVSRPWSGRGPVGARLAQTGGHLRHGRAVLRPGCQHPHQQVGQRTGAPRRLDLARGHPVQERHRVLVGAEGRPPLEHGVQRRAEGEHVGCRGRLLALGHLGGQVGGGAGDEARRRQ